MFVLFVWLGSLCLLSGLDFVSYLCRTIEHSKGFTNFPAALCIYILTGHGHFIRYTLLVPGWTPFCLQNWLNSLWHRFNKVLETFLRDFGPYWHDSITQLLQICRLHIHDVNLPFHHQQPFHVQSHLNLLSSPFWCSVWTSASRLPHI